MFKVKQIAEELDVSKPTVYNHIKKLKKELRPYMYKKKGVTYLEPEGIELIRQSVNGDVDYNNDLKDEDSGQPLDPDIKELLSDLNAKIETLESEYIENLRQQNARLEEELDRKNKQFENFQVLLKQNQERILELEGEGKEERQSLWKRLRWWDNE